MTDLLFMMKSRFTVEVTGESPERFLNLAAAKGIYVSEVRPVPGGLRVNMSRRAVELMKDGLPSDITMKILREHGAVRFFRGLKKRYLLLAGLPAAALIVILSTRFLWRVNVNGGTQELREKVSAFMTERGVVPGAKIKDLDQNQLKRDAIMAIDELMWVWVDIHGTTADINIADRDMPPEIISSEPANVIASEPGVIEQLTVTGGTPVVEEGQTVERGALLISGIIESERLDAPMVRRGSGAVLARVWRNKTVLIPKITTVRQRTGNIKKIKAIKIKKFIVNFSLNSSILYPKYDRIRLKYKLGQLPVEFISDTYSEVEEEQTDTDIAAAKAEIKAGFEKEISVSGARLEELTEEESDKGDYIEYGLTARCLTDIGKTVPIE